jgi:uncharacterized membrane protein
MTYTYLKFAHVLGAILMGAGLIGVWMADLRSRQLRELGPFSEAVRNIAIFYDGLVVPGAVLLLASGSWMIASLYGWQFLDVPWLLGMVILFAAEFIEGNTITRLYFIRLRRLTQVALAEGQVTPELERARVKSLPTFTHFLDLPMFFLIVSLGTVRPSTWTHFVVGLCLAVAAGALLSVALPRLYSWDPRAQVLRESA